MKRTLRSTPFISNPYVVFADLASALAFIFLVYSLATSQAIVGVTRLQRQNATLAIIERSFQQKYQGADIHDAARFDKKKHAHQKVREFWDMRGGRLLMEVKTNAGLQRISIRNVMFDKGAEFMSDEGAGLLDLVGAAAQTSRDQYTYMIIEGVVERTEGLNAKDSVELSRKELKELMFT